MTSNNGFDHLQCRPASVQESLEAAKEQRAQPENWLSLATVFTAALLHADIGHIVSNLFFLWIFAGLVNELLGWRWMLTIFVFTAICGSIGDIILRSGSPIPALGASGAVMGLEGAYLGLAVRYSLPNPSIWPLAYPVPPFNLAVVAVVGFFFDISGVFGPETGTAYGAHLGGFIAGLVLTSLITPAPRISR